jgi:glutaredoxin 3
MITLYYKPTCAFCRRVLAVVDRLSLEVELKDIVSDEAAATELVTVGGKLQVPYLIDATTDTALYESDDIVAYLQKQYGQPTVATRPRIHISDSTCVSCEA